MVEPNSLLFVQQDNARPHVERTSPNSMKTMNLVNSLQTLLAVWHELHVTRDTIPQEVIDYLLESMPRVRGE